MPLNLSAHEHTVSAVNVNGRELFVRFIADYHEGPEAAAFELRATQVENADDVCAFLQRVQAAQEYLYVFEQGD